jgi:cellulose synthase/poly-beta-1,6-N-acetylglucosamine synthase-like glycosyltransferase
MLHPSEVAVAQSPQSGVKLLHDFGGSEENQLLHNELELLNERHVQCFDGGGQGGLIWRPCSPRIAKMDWSWRPYESPGLCRMLTVAAVLAAAPVTIAIYAYIVYPVILLIIARLRPARIEMTKGVPWPTVTITVPVYNAASRIRSTLEHILLLDYPRERLQVLVISDASTDGTDDIVREFAVRGVELLRLPRRIGKTAAENAALSVARGEIIVNVDASILVPTTSLRPLVRVFDDPMIGVASGRDVSVGDAGHSGTGAESSYTGYEMWIRDLETRVGSIVGASGCFYGIRRSIHAKPLPVGLSWDFASPLVAQKQGYRSVSVPAAVCLVPRTAEIRTEITRKVRTMARGLRTLFYLRALMNPLRYGSFALMLISHKLLRWVPYLLAPISFAALCLLAVQSIFARMLLGLVIAGLLVGTVGVYRRRSTESTPVALAAFAVAVLAAGIRAWWDAFKQTQMATWEPTPRPGTQA